MFVVTVTFEIAKDSVERFLPLMLENAKRSVEDEPGCRQFDVCQHPQHPTRIFLYEVYDTAEAFDIHRTMPHYKVFSEMTAPMVTGKTVDLFERIES